VTVSGTVCRQSRPHWHLLSGAWQ